MDTNVGDLEKFHSKSRRETTTLEENQYDRERERRVWDEGKTERKRETRRRCVIGVEEDFGEVRSATRVFMPASARRVSPTSLRIYEEKHAS